MHATKDWDFTPQKCQVTMLETLESEGDIVVVWKLPKGSTKEQSLWRIVHALEQLVGEQAGFCEEVARIQKSSKRTEGILQELVDQTKAFSDAMELFVWGEHFQGPGRWANWRGQKRQRVF